MILLAEKLDDVSDLDLSFKTIILILLFALLSGYFIDNFSSSIIGYYVSLIIFVTIVSCIFINLKIAYFLFIVFSLASPRFSRELVLQIIASDNSSVDIFYSFHSVSLVGFSLSSLTIMIFGFYSIFKICLTAARFSPKITIHISAILLVLLILIVSTFINTIVGGFFDFRAVISDLRLYLIALCAICFTHYMVSLLGVNYIMKITFRAILVSTVIIGVRTIVFMISDYLNMTVKLEFSTEPYSSYAVMFAVLMSKLPHFKKFVLVFISFLASISMKRLDMAMFVACVLIMLLSFLVTRSRRDLNHSRQSFVLMLIIISAILFLIAIYLPKSFNFLTYKLSFFTQELWGESAMSGSASVRKYELVNIWSKNNNNIWAIFFGQGLGGYFDFTKTGYPIALGVSDFSRTELISNMYQKPHSFLNFMLLKGGLFLLFSYCAIFFVSIYLSLRKLSVRRFLELENNDLVPTHYWFLVFYSVFCLNMYWQPVHSFVFLILFICLLLSFKEKNVNS